MPYLKESIARAQALADAPTLGNMHPDARSQAIARASLADGERMAERLHWLHSPESNNVDGYEWGIYRVKWVNGKAAEVWQTNGDFSDLDEAIAATKASGAVQAEPVAELLAEIERLKIRGAAYEEAYGIALRATYQSHTGHWDKTGQHGLGCPECIRAREARENCDAVIKRGLETLIDRATKASTPTPGDAG